jgi:hypothetical protein
VNCSVTEYTTGESIKTSKVKWIGTCADPSRSGRDEGPQMRKACLDFLIDIFSAEYEVASIDIQRAAKEYGLPWRTLCEYKPKFKIGSVKMRDGHWAWRAPEGGLGQFKKVTQ